jgi:hypothetical protein
MLPALWSEARRNARAGKDGAGLLLYWIETGQADARSERLSRLAKPIEPEALWTRPSASTRHTPIHDPSAFRVWGPLLSEVIPGVIPEESIRTWLDPLSAEAWDGEVLQLRADSEAAYRWITQQLAEELESIGIAIKIMPPKTNPQLP